VANTVLGSSVLGINDQASTDPAYPQSAAPVDTNNAALGTSTQYRNARETRTTLSADLIIRLLQEKPEVTVEIKKLMSAQLLQQGISIQDDAITDEMLFNHIASDASLRLKITTWLRARGYITDADIRRARMEGELDEDGMNSDTLRRSLAGPGDESEMDAGLGTRSSDPLLGSNSLTSSDLLAMQNTQELPIDRTTIAAGRSALENDPLARRNNKNDMPETDAAMQRSMQDKKAEQPADEALMLHQPAPYNLLSLRDLYTQVPVEEVKLKRFGSEMFLSRGLLPKEMPIDVPMGPDYVLGPGDGITIDLWGGLSQSFTRVVDREGKVVLPEAGPVMVAGMPLERAQAVIQETLAPQFRNAHVAVTVARLRTIRIYVVGDVQRPGAYDISSLSTPLNALFAAGGPTRTGSLRTLRHYRGKELLREVDLYDFLLKGVHAGVERMEPGDTILLPPAGPQVAVSGSVKRPAIYELKGESNLDEVLQDAGGLQVSAALGHISVERIEDQHRETLKVPLPAGGDSASVKNALAAFTIKDGDRVMVAPVVPWSEKAVYVEGHVVRPGRYPYHDGMQLSDVLHTYQDLLPEPSDHGEVVRLVPPELRPETIEFSVQELLVGNAQILLQPFDTVRILGRYETDAPRVTVRGEVLRPGVYAMSQGMTAAQLVRMADGFKRDALLTDADLASYEIKDGMEVVSQRTTVHIGAAVKGGVADADVALKPGDVLTVHQVSGWNDIGASVKVQGEARYPGTYGLQEGERLSSVLLRAGGFRSTAYPAGAMLLRTEVRALEEKSRAEMIHQIENSSAAARLQPNANGQDQTATLQLLIQQQNEVLQRLRSQAASGRLVIKINSDINSWANTDADIEMRAGDVLLIPKRPAFVLVSGQVYNASAITFVPGQTAGWYLKHAGGATDLANRKEIFVVRANGSVVGRRSGEWYQGDVLSVKLNPGDVVVVPQKIIGGSMFWRNMLTTAQIASSIAITVALAGL